LIARQAALAALICDEEDSVFISVKNPH
jgi:hypothetical protein